MIPHHFDARAQIADAQRFIAGLEHEMALAGWMPESGIYAVSSVPPPLLDDEDDDIFAGAEIHDTQPSPPPKHEP